MIMNFKVHRRNKSLAVTAPSPQVREGRSLRKVTYHEPLPEALLLQAKAAYHTQQDLNQAIALFQQYLAFSPRCNEALYLCGVCELKVGNPERALALLGIVSDSYPGKPNAMLLEAMALNKLSRGQAALTAANECVRRFPRYEQGLCFRGKLLMGMARFQQAEHDFSILAARPESSFLPHHALGDCYRAQGHPERALDSYLKALELLKGGETTLLREVRLKVGACLYQLERWEDAIRVLQSTPDKNCDCYYYLGTCEVQLNRKEEALLHLEYCLRLQGRPTLMLRAYKQLLQLHLRNSQFYEALEVVQLGRQAGVTPKGWADVVQSFMAIIKGHYEEGVAVLNEVWLGLKGKEQSKRLVKFRRDSSQPKTRYNESSSGQILKVKEGKLRYFSTKSVLRAVPKISSTRMQVAARQEAISPKEEEWGYSSSERELMCPLILRFKAYGQFFTNQLFSCLDTCEEYQSFMKDVFGKDSDIQYNKWLCEGLLMADNDMLDEALLKYNNCIQLYQETHGQLPIEPILYKVCLLVRAAVHNAKQEHSQHQTIQKGEGQTHQEDSSIISSPVCDSILGTVLELMDEFQPVLSRCSLALYFRSLVCFLLGRIQDSNYFLQRSLKVAEDCSWRWLWAKGAIEVRLGNYHEAVKQFSAGLILQSRAQLYLGRSIAFLLLSEEKTRIKSVKKGLGGSLSMRVGILPKNDGSAVKRQQMIQNCFEDLQKYIELENNQEQISLWVSKVLFANGAYDEAARSLSKITRPSQEVQLMREAVAVYEGDFKQGGALGSVIQAAFDGKYLPSARSSSFQKWLMVLDLYVKEDYNSLLKHLQRQLFESEEGAQQILLKFNVAVVYLLLADRGKALNALRGLVSKDDSFQLSSTVSKLEYLTFDRDECLQELREEVGLSCSRLLSNYLPYRSVSLSAESRIYVRPSIPFPEFPRPALNLWLDGEWVAGEVSVRSIEKRIQAPWIRRGENMRVQFTSELQSSGLLGESCQLKQSQALMKESREIIGNGEFAIE